MSLERSGAAQKLRVEMCEESELSELSPLTCAGSPALCRSGRFCFVGPVTNGTIFCLHGTCWQTSRISSGVRVLWLEDGLGMVCVGWCFPGCQNCLIKRTHW